MDFSAFIEDHGELLVMQAGTHVFRQGDQNRMVYLVREGLLKAYYMSDDGKEAIKSFIMPGDFIGSLTATYKKGTCSFSLVCQEPSTLLQVDFEALLAASRQHVEIASSLLEFLLGFAMKKERREMELLSLSAEDRYRLLVERSPELLEHVKQKDIARYLGITPVALSRIRKRIGG